MSVKVRAGKTSSILSNLAAGRSVQILAAHLSDDSRDLVEELDGSLGYDSEWEKIPWAELEPTAEALWQIALILTRRLVQRPDSLAHRANNDVCGESVIRALHMIALSCDFFRKRPVAQFYIQRLTEVSKNADLAAKMAKLLAKEIVEYDEDPDVDEQGIARYNYAAMLACLGAPGVPALTNYLVTYDVQIDKALELMMDAETRTADTDPRKTLITDVRQKLAGSLEGLQKLAGRTV